MKQTSLSNFMEGEDSMKVHRKGFIESQESTIGSMNTSIPKPIRWHKTHRLLFVFDYDGIQPLRYADKIVKFGRYGTINEAYFNIHEDNSIVITLPHTLKVWVKHPKGIKTQEQLVEARKTAWEVVRGFAVKHGITILKEKSKAKFSEHTIENKNLEKLIKPIVEKEPDLSLERLGLSINKVSHKDKVEWKGTKAKELVMALEWWLEEGINRFQILTKTNTLLIDEVQKISENLSSVVEWIKKR